MYVVVDLKVWSLQFQCSDSSIIKQFNSILFHNAMDGMMLLHMHNGIPILL